MVRFTDLELIQELLRNSRRTYVELAKTFGVTEAAIRKRIKKLESENIIKRFTIEVDLKKLGFEVHALIGLDSSPEKLIQTLEELQNMKEVVSLYTSSGDHMILIECWFRNMKQLSDFIKKLEKIDGVTKICPAIILEKIK
ncbi:MAG: Lrp/AsnC family transcriptional regulator [Nitrososphaerota archaeon]|nr:Lrp/AsnC family transcriptional regulator [Candidatus Geocrenenecus dongiae]